MKAGNPLFGTSNDDLKAPCQQLNGTPRMCLGFRTPRENFIAEALAETTKPR